MSVTEYSASHVTIPSSTERRAPIYGLINRLMSRRKHEKEQTEATDIEECDLLSQFETGLRSKEKDKIAVTCEVLLCYISCRKHDIQQRLRCSGIETTMRNEYSDPGTDLAGPNERDEASWDEPCDAAPDKPGLRSLGLEEDAFDFLEDSIDRVDWDVQIEEPPTRPSHTAVVILEAGFYRVPGIVNNPEE